MLRSPGSYYIQPVGEKNDISNVCFLFEMVKIQFFKAFVLLLNLLSEPVKTPGFLIWGFSLLPGNRTALNSFFLYCCQTVNSALCLVIVLFTSSHYL